MEHEASLVQMRARGLLKRYVANGVVTKTPCMACGDVEVVAHHVDYSRPLQVVWLCRGHHNQIHHPVRTANVQRQERWATKPQDAFL